MSRVILKGFILVADEDLPVVREELRNHIQLTLQEEGCLVFEVSEDEENINRFNVYEEFSDSRSFELHQERVRNSNWAKVSKNVERNYQSELVK